MENKIKYGFKVVKKAKKEKKNKNKSLTNMLSGTKRKKLCTCKVNGGRWRRFIQIQNELQGWKNCKKGKQKNKCRKNNRFKKVKVKIIK